MQPVLQKITIYPIKSLGGLAMEKVEVLPSGGLANDRRFALLDQEGRVINGKRTAALHSIHAEFDLSSMTARLQSDRSETKKSFSLIQDRTELEAWFSNVLGIPCDLVEDTAIGFPDDTDASGPTLISTATLEQVVSWFPGLTLEEARLRFRTNLEIGGVEPFWEDRLISSPKEGVPFSIGLMGWLGMKVCQRCVVPTRHSSSGERTPGFQKKFSLERERSLPPWAARERFDHFYRLAVNTRLAPAQSPGMLRVGDAVYLD